MRKKSINSRKMIKRIKLNWQLVQLKKDDPQTKLKAGDILKVQVCDCDPFNKYNVICRVSDSYNPHCDILKKQVEKM